MSEYGNAGALIGTRLGSCVLQRPLGIGGMGAVYLARQERPRRTVAVKVLRPQLAADPQAWAIFRARFRREADATAGLDHANIVPIYEFGEDEEIAYLVMPYLADGSLADLLAREHTLPLDRALAYLEQAAAALDYAHQHGIIHRDVKPSNLLLHPDGRLMLADFGIARPLGRTRDEGDIARAPLAALPIAADATLTQAGMAMGTPQYMAPEQIRGEPVSPATDTYALANVAYIMLTGNTPFSGRDTFQIFRRQLTEPPQPLRGIRPDIPPRVEEVIFWGLAKHPNDRPQSSGAFASALREASHPGAFGGILGRVAPFRAGARGLGAQGLISEETAETPRRPANGTLPLEQARESGRLPLRMGTAPSRAPVSARGRRGDTPETLFADEPNAPTLFGPAGGFPADHVPEWPVPPSAERPRRQSKHPRLRLLALLGGIGAVVLVVALLAASLSQSLMPASPVGSPSPIARAGGVTHQVTATPRPTATATPSPSPTATPVPPADWLSVSPGAVTLGCKKHQGISAILVLSNVGPQATGWSASFAQSVDPGARVTPTSGTLASGRHANITITNTTLFFSHTGTLLITPTSGDAGQPASVEYKTIACY